MSERTVVHQKLLTNATTLNTAGTMGPSVCSQGREWTFHVYFTPGTTAGKVKIEAATDEAATGTWALQGSEVSWATADTDHTVSITGTFLALRARVSTAVVAGTGVNVQVVGS
jgi:F420-0:gamma-glutamyl ligase-like protein